MNAARRLQQTAPASRPQPIRVPAPLITPAMQRGLRLALGNDRGMLVADLLELCRNHVLNGVWILNGRLYLRPSGHMQGRPQLLRWDRARHVVYELWRRVK